MNFDKIIRGTFLLMLLNEIGNLEGKIIRWIPNCNFDNPANWDNGQLPCRNDHVILPAKAPPIYIQRNETLLELVLPNDGEVIFANGASITIPQNSDGSCQEKTVRFKQITSKSWFDLDHWCVTNDTTNNCAATQPELLSIETIPCQSDDVIFPTGSFPVDLESGVDIRIASLRISNRNLDTTSFHTYLESDDGKKQFVYGNVSSTSFPTTVTITGSQCQDSTGCACANGQRSVLNRVCSLQSVSCENILCGNPFQPTGHCCHLCGAMLTMNYNSQFTLAALKNVIADIFRNLNINPDGVKVIVSKLENNQIQAVLASTSNEIDAMQVGQGVKEELDKGEVGALNVTLFNSETNVPDRHTGEVVPMSAGSTVAVIFVVVIILAFAALAVYCYMNKDRCFRLPPVSLASLPRMPPLPSLPSPSFLRSFRQRGGKSDRQVHFELRPQKVVFDNNTIFEGNLAGFENPSYGDMFAPATFRYDPTAEVSDSDKSGFNNPMYVNQPIEVKMSLPDDDDDDVYNKKAAEKKKEKADEEGGADNPQHLKKTPEKMGFTFLDKLKPKKSSEKPTNEARKEEEEEEEKNTSRVIQAETKKEEESAPVEGKREIKAKDEEPLGRRFRLPFGIGGGRGTGKVEKLEEEEERGGEEGLENGKNVGKEGKVWLGRQSKQPHRKLEEEYEPEEKRKIGKDHTEMEDSGGAGFGNPLYSMDDIEVVEKDLGVVEKDLGESEYYRPTSRKDRRARSEKEKDSKIGRKGFENPLFEDSKMKLEKGDDEQRIQTLQLSGAVQMDDDSTI